MKTIILLLLVMACGKHEEAKYQDLQDNDGDQITNEEEKKLGTNPNIADVVNAEKISVGMSFKMGSTVLTEHIFTLSNGKDLTAYSRQLMLGEKNAPSIKHFFSEWATLKLESGQIPPLFNQSHFRVDLNLGKKLIGDYSLVLFKNQETKVLNKWEESLSITLTKEELQGILNGEMFLGFTNQYVKRGLYFTSPQEETVKEKTYRVIFNDGKSTQIFYISKNFTFEEFMTSQNIQVFSNMEKENLLTTTHSYSQSSWWVKQIDSETYLVVYENLRNLSDLLFNHFEKTALVLTRLDGKTGKVLKISKSDSARVLFKIRGAKVMNQFYRKQKKKVGGDPGYKYYCKYIHTTVVGQQTSLLSTSEIVDVIQVSSNGSVLSPDQVKIKFLEGVDESGTFTEVTIDSPLQELEVVIKNSAASTYKNSIEIFEGECGEDDLRFESFNEEQKMDLNVEAFVEKI